jgi:nucleotide-binding universal stress UspA family protein
MIRKIICPTDLSQISINAGEYAANLARVFGAELIFMNVQRIIPAAAAVSMGEGIDSGARENSLRVAERLKDMCTEATRMFHVKARYEVMVTTHSFVKTLTQEEAQSTLIVIGTNGADNMYQYLFGSTSYQVIKNAKSPVLVIPENTTFTPMKKIVFSWDYSPKGQFSFSLLHDFRKAFDPEFVFLHVSKTHSELSKDLFRALCDEIETVLGKDKKVSFNHIYSDDIPQSIDEFVRNTSADLLSLTYYDRGFPLNLFHGKVAKELSETTGYPILVLHA